MVQEVRLAEVMAVQAAEVQEELTLLQVKEVQAQQTQAVAVVLADKTPIQVVLAVQV